MRKLLVLILAMSSLSAMESSEEQMDFMQRFFCVVSTQMYIRKNNNLIPQSEAPEHQQALRKLLTVLFRECLDDVSTDQVLMTNLLQLQTQEELATFPFPFQQRFDLNSFSSQSDFSMTQEEEELYALSRETIDQILKMQNEAKGGPKDSQRDEPHQQNGQQQGSLKEQGFSFLEFLMNSQFKNLFIFSGIAGLLILLNTLVNLCRPKKEEKVEEKQKAKNGVNKKKKE